MFFLIVNPPNEKPVVRRFEQPSVTIGSSLLNDVCLTDPSASRLHAEVRREGEQYLLLALDPDYVTICDGEVVESEVELFHGRIIQVGETEIVFQEIPEAKEQTSAGAHGLLSGITGRLKAILKHTPPQPDAVQEEHVESGQKNLLKILGGSQDDAGWLAPEFFRRAAVCYEQTGLLRDAADCWVRAGGADRAASLFLAVNDYEKAMPLLLAEGRYADTLTACQAWLKVAKPDDYFALVSSRLGIAVSLNLMRKEPERAREAYRAARTLVEADAGRNPFMSARCWEALAEYGSRVGRADLVQVGYEQALTLYGPEHNDERIRAALTYLSAVKENRLLSAEIETRLADWVPADDGRTGDVRDALPQEISDRARFVE
jgi:tetratricopeptide (TPR) repeat protein